jgi:hypothetical protein
LFKDYEVHRNADQYLQRVLERVAGEGIYEDEDSRIFLFRLATSDDDYNLVPEVVRSLGVGGDRRAAQAGIDGVTYRLNLAGYENEPADTTEADSI